MNNFKTIDIKDLDDNTFLHYTNINNLESISKNGLQPKIGKNAKVIEKTKKIFFSIGEKGVLVIMDTWLKWLVSKPKSNIIYYIGAYLLKVPFFPKSIHKVIIKFMKNDKKYKWAYENLKSILDSSVYLVLDLEENVDFRYDDIDEVKKLSKFPPAFIKNLYAYDSDVLDYKQEYWNMHTISNKVIEPNKIYLLKLNDKFKASYILKYLIEKNKEFVQENCQLLSKYYNYYENNSIQKKY